MTIGDDGEEAATTRNGTGISKTEKWLLLSPRRDTT